MSDSFSDDPHEILDALATMGDLHAQVEGVFRAIRLADLANDDEASMRSRLTLLCIAPRTRYANEMITAFTWCHGKLESDPRKFAYWEEDIIEQFDLMIVTLVDYPQVELEHLTEIINQMETCYRRLQLPMRRVAEQRFTTALRTGRLQEAQNLLIPWLTTDEPESPEMRAWERLSQFELLMLQDKMEEGLELLKRNLTNRNGLSGDVFLWSVSHAMRPLCLLDRMDEAKKYQRQAMPLLKEEPTDALGAGAHIAFLCRTGRIAEAVQVFEEFIQPGMEAPDPDAHFRIFAASAGLLKKLGQQGANCQLRLPDCHPLKRSDATYDCEELHGWFESEARRIGNQFDQRNGNDYFLGRLYHYYNY